MTKSPKILGKNRSHQPSYSICQKKNMVYALMTQNREGLNKFNMRLICIMSYIKRSICLMSYI